MAKDKEKVSREEFDNLAAKVRRMSDNWKRYCARAIGDDKDGEVGSARLAIVVALAVVSMAGLAFAEQASEAADKENWVVAAVRGNGDYDTDGSIVAAGTITSAGSVASAQSAVSVVAGSTNTLAGGLNIYTSSGSAAAITNTIVLTRPTGTGVEVYYLQNAIDATNLLAIAASGAWNSSAVELDAGEMAIVYSNPNGDGPGTNAWLGAEL